MKVIVIDPEKRLNYVDVAYELVRLDSVLQMQDIPEYNVDILVLNDKITDTSLIDTFSRENVWKICIHEDFEKDYPVTKWKEFCFVEIIKTDFDFSKLRSLEDSTALINNKINFKDKFDFDSVMNKKLQSAVDSVFKDDVNLIEDNNMSDDNSGLKIKVPNTKQDDTGASLNISMELGDDSNIHENVTNQAEEMGLDMGELGSSALSLGASEETLDAVPQENAGDLDFSSDTPSPSFALHAKDDAVESISIESDLISEADDLDASINGLDDIDDFDGLDLSSDELDNLDEVGESEDGAGEEDDFGLAEEVIDTVGEVTGKTQVTSSEDLDEIKAVVAKSLMVKAPVARADETGEIDISTLLKEADDLERTGPTKNIQNYSNPKVNIKEQVADANYASVNSNYSADDLLDIKITLSELRDDRKNLLNEIANLEQDKDLLLRQNLNLKADFDELKIELSIMKKRHIAELEDYKQQNSVLLGMREVLETKNKNYQREIERLGSKIRIDFGKIKQREKELEGQLELVSIDADSKVKSRDLKILELKRKIDALEFNMENITIKEKQSIQDKSVLEDKLNRVVGTLRNSLSLLEQDIDISEITKSFKRENDL